MCRLSCFMALMGAMRVTNAGLIMTCVPLGLIMMCQVVVKGVQWPRSYETAKRGFEVSFR